MSDADPRHSPITQAWPIQVALAIIVALAAGMVGFDLIIARRVAGRTEEIVENTQRSVELLEDLHSEAFELARAELRPPAIAAIRRRLTGLGEQYEPIANGPGEHEEWLKLQAELAQLSAEAESGRPVDLRAQTDAIDRRIDRLIAMNRMAAHVHSDEIRRAHHQAIAADGAVGAVVLLLCVAVALVLRRILARQRALFAAHIALLDERNRELDLFAGRAAHDMRAPLSPIRGYADLLATGAESPEEVQLMAGRIRAAVDKMARVVDDMLELSRAGRPLPGRASARAAITEVVDELAPDLRGAQIEVHVPDTQVACAPGVLQQLIRNLVQNAVKFRARERVLVIRIRGRIHAEGPQPEMIELEIEDNGVGMDAELAAHAFQPHYRGRTDLEVPGHGLGLAIVERATHALGGSIRLRSAPDEGCLFTISLPTAK